MQLSPLQSRLAASLAASLIVLALYLLLFSPDLALAAELPLPVDGLLSSQLEFDAGLQPAYEPEFALFDRGIVGRQTEALPIGNNEPKASNLNANQTACYVLERNTIFGGGDLTNSARSFDIDGDPHINADGEPMRRQAETRKTVYISANTCLQPFAVDPAKAGSAPPQLSLYISTSSQDGACPDPSKDNPDVQVRELKEGALMYSANVTGAVYITVAAPDVSTDFGGNYNFELATSVDEYYHKYDTTDSVELLWMDSDSNSALLVSRDLTKNKDDTDRILKEKLPYSLYVQNTEWPTAMGLQRSACGLGTVVQIMANGNGDSTKNHMVNTTLTTRGTSSLPKQQFFLDGLNSTSSYSGILVSNANNSTAPERRAAGSVGGGGTVFAPTTFPTRSTENCQLVTDLEFCSETQYTTPGDENRFKTSELSKLYDDFAKDMYSNFEKALMQVPCEAGSASRYSLAKDCNDCKFAYKQWLCLVAIPRCEDYSFDDGAAVVRNIGSTFPNGTKLPDEERAPLENQLAYNSSRNSWIDDNIQPGPYKEILPCLDMCHAVVQSCPAILGFSCPVPGEFAADASYGPIASCNYPGEARTKIGAAGVLRPRVPLAAVVSVALAGLLLS